ncbi:MAG: glycosyltransferase [Polyangiaceae bacterium]|nr:glycosyltransferase [Polyangiaceae bacterium]
MSGPRFSVIVVTWNNLALTVRCMESLLRTVPHHAEIIVVDNGSTDGTRGYLDELSDRNPVLRKIILLEENRGWCRGVNLGLAQAKGAYIVLLNNDVVVTPEWLEGLREAMDEGPAAVPGARRVGIVGPVSNAVAGAQAVANPPPYDPSTLDDHARRHRAAMRRNWGTSWFLSGFCMMIHRDCLAETGGLDERFSPGGFDDNDLVLRAQERGWDCMIAGDVYVHHDGSATFQRYAPEKRGGLVNRAAFLAKWRERRAGPRRLVAAYRVKDAASTLRESLDATAAFADAIVVLDDGSSDETPRICRDHPAVTRYERQDLPFDERRDRNRVLAMAAELAPDWIISIDADEVFELDRARAQRLMHLSDPHVKVLGFHWYTFWEPSRTYFRADGIFGGMSGYRMYRHEPGLRIVHGTESGLHCGNIPALPDGGARFTDVRVRHLGYDSEELRRQKLARYERLDPSPRPELVGGATYGHIVSATVTLRRYAPEGGVSLCLITKDEEERLEQFLAYMEPFVSEICVVDTGSADATVRIARLFTDRVEIAPQRRMDLAEARNRCLALATRPWILSMDPDEEVALGDLPRLARLMDDPEAHAYTFQVANHQKDTPPVMTLAVRLFRRDPRIHYTRPVHETLEQSLERLPGAVVHPSGVPIQHYGYLKSDDVVERKVVQYHERGREYREEHPEDPLPWYNEALHLLNEGREDEAAAFLRRALQLDDKFLSPRSQLAHMHQERAMALWRELVGRLPADHPMRRIAEESAAMLAQITPPRPLVGAARRRSSV